MLIKQTDYHRIYSVINSLLLSENANPATASMYFSVFGSYLLKQHFKVNASPKSGLAAYRLGQDAILFADKNDEGFVTGEGENFHCWIEADGWAIDFMAPALSLNGRSIAAKMFQKPLKAMASSINDVQTSGDFFYVSTPKATAQRFAGWKDTRAIGDMARLAEIWFRKSPKKMMPSMTVTDEFGAARQVQLTGNALTGSW
jgi:hypothetical protein